MDPIAEDYPHLSSFNYASNKPITSIDEEGLQSPDEPEVDNENNSINEALPNQENKTDKVDNLEDLPNTLPLVEVTATAPWHVGVKWSKTLPSGARIGELELGGLKIIGTDYGPYGSDFKYLHDKLNSGEFTEVEFFYGAMAEALENDSDRYSINTFRNEKARQSEEATEVLMSLAESFAPPIYREGDDVLSYFAASAAFIAGSVNPTPDGGNNNRSNRSLVKEKKLPLRGLIRFIPRKSDLKNKKLTKKDGGYVDKFGNIWKKGPSRTSGEAWEWDVQLSQTGLEQLKEWRKGRSHLNVSLKGRVTH